LAINKAYAALHDDVEAHTGASQQVHQEVVEENSAEQNNRAQEGKEMEANNE
jgi:hypothetical protein